MIIHARFVQGTCYSIAAAITIEGYIATRAVEGSVDGLESINYILDDVVRLSGDFTFYLSYGRKKCRYWSGA